MNKKIEKVNDWRDVVRLPIFDSGRAWDLDQLESVLRKAIANCAQVCLESQGMIFTTLSGGLDSSFSLAILRQLHPEALIQTFTIGSNENHPDIKFAQIVSEKFQTKHHQLIPNGMEIEKAREEITEESPGEIGVHLLYQSIARLKPKFIIVHDGIDELLGGYWGHREYDDDRQRLAFEKYWGELIEKHLIPLEKIARSFNISLLFPYLQLPLVKYIMSIPFSERTSRKESKIPLRLIARKYLPESIINRKKIGFCDNLTKF